MIAGDKYDLGTSLCLFQNLLHDVIVGLWPQTHNDVVQKILEKAKRGTEIIFIPGNHDEVARDFVGLTLGGIKVKDDDIHQTVDGKKFWVVHGDLFDNVIQHARWPSSMLNNIVE